VRSGKGVAVASDNDEGGSANHDPSDSYRSDRLGEAHDDESVLGGDGTPIIGLLGKSNSIDVTGLGLLLKTN
jgi:hypothetical protein